MTAQYNTGFRLGFQKSCLSVQNLLCIIAQLRGVKVKQYSCADLVNSRFIFSAGVSVSAAVAVVEVEAVLVAVLVPLMVQLNCCLWRCYLLLRLSHTQQAMW